MHTLREREQMECDTQPSLIQVCFLTERKENCLTLHGLQYDGVVTDTGRRLAHTIIIVVGDTFVSV